jgi:outer membrane protein assembly factor BamB
LFCSLLLLQALVAQADDWPRWRGPAGNGVSSEKGLPVTWGPTENIRWKAAIPGQGSSSPIVCGDRIFLTASHDQGARRVLVCLDRATGQTTWTYEIQDDWPEITSALTGHAAATPATNGECVVAFFGNAGVVCCSMQGQLLWRTDLDDFESELGLASSPVIYQDMVILVCDHDGDRFNSFDSFLIALDLKTGETRWKTERRGLFRSWSTPILVPAPVRDNENAESLELIVAGQDKLRAYDPNTGKELWTAEGLTGWVAPSPVFADGLIFAASGKDGLTLAVRPGGRGDVTDTHVVWSERRGAPYVSSPVYYENFVYIANELGVVTCRKSATGEIAWQKRLEGKFFASPIAGDGKVYLPADSGRVYVIAASPSFELLAENNLGEELLASPAVAHGCLFLRTASHLYCVVR